VHLLPGSPTPSATAHLIDDERIVFSRCIGRDFWIGIVLVSIVLFYGHYYKDVSGVIDSGVAGLILGIAYMLAGRNL